MLLGAAVLVIVGNTIRLDIQTRTEEIEVAKLLGATRLLCAWPFLYLGLWYGVFGSLVAVLILAISLWVLMRSPPRGLYGSSLELAGVGLGTLGAELVAAYWHAGAGPAAVEPHRRGRQRTEDSQVIVFDRF